MSSAKNVEPVIMAQLESILGNGVNLYLDGQEATIHEVAQICVREDVLYMPDYVIDEAGILREVRYDKISVNE